jgi:SAM-dependent methyltransferase
MPLVDNLVRVFRSVPAGDSRWRFAPENAQLDYYREAAGDYDEAQVHEGDEHYQNLGLIESLIRQGNIRSVLDVGCGTGRGIRYLRQHMPDLEVHGIDPSPDLLKIATERHGVPRELLHCADALSAPFPPGSFDAVMSLAVLHHVPQPHKIVRRMIELTRKAIFISDANYIGQGSLSTSIAKLLINRAGAWPFMKFVQQGFKGWACSTGDGVFYSYSVFDDLPLLEDAFTKVFVVPAGSGAKRGIAFPMLRAPVVLAVGLR